MSRSTDRLVVVARFAQPPEAHIARSMLESEGIAAALDGEHHIAMDWLISNAIGGVKLLVHQRDLQRAVELLHEAMPDVRVVDIDGETFAEAGEVCPNCGSHEVFPQRLERRMTLLSLLLLGLPLPFLSRRMACMACGHRWKP